MKKMHHLLTIGISLIAFNATAEDQINILTGGVGEDERLQFEELQKDYNLKLVFTGERGMYLSDVQVMIFDEDNNIVVDTLTEGPILLAKLPAGKYEMETRVASFEKSRAFRLTKHLRVIELSYPVKDAPALMHEYEPKNDAIDASMSQDENGVVEKAVEIIDVPGDEDTTAAPQEQDELIREYREVE